MRLKVNAEAFASVIFPIGVLLAFWMFSEVSNEVPVFFLGLPFALSTFVLSYIVLSSNKDKKFLVVRCYANVLKILLMAAVMTSVFGVIFVVPFEGSLDWTSIPLTNWLRYIGSVFLTFFLPGYFLLKIFDKHGLIEPCGAISLSYILSTFTVFITSFTLLAIFGSIPSLVNYVLVAINLALMIIYYARSPSQGYVMLRVELLELGAFLATMLVTTVGNIYVMIETSPLSLGDMWVHHADALRYANGFPVYSGLLIPNYPYFFEVVLATFFKLSGLASPIAYQTLFLLSFVTPLSFYSFIRQWFRDKRDIQSIAVLLVSLLGFGSLYVIDLLLNNRAMTLANAIHSAMSKTYEIDDVMIIGPILSNVVPVLYIGLPTLFMFLFLLQKALNQIQKLILSSFLVAESYLAHIAEPFFMALALLLYSAVFKDENSKVWAVGGIVGLLIVLLIDSVAPVRFYVWGLGYLSSSSSVTFLATLSILTLSFIISVLSRRLPVPRLHPLDRFKKASSMVAWLVFYAYITSFMAWLYALPSYDALKYGHYDFTPFFVWPTRFGPVGLLFVSFLVPYFREILKDRRLLFFFLIAISGLVLEQLANYYAIYPAYRFATFTFIGTVVVAAYGIVRSFTYLNNNNGTRRILLAAILIFLVFPGMLSSSLFYFDRARLKPNIDNYELDALNFVRSTLASNSTILTLSDDSARKLETFAGVNTVQVMQRWNYIFAKATDLSIFLHIFGTSNVRYIYLSRYDQTMLKNSYSLLYALLDHLPIAFRNEETIIYEVPNISPPSKSSNFEILNFLEPSTSAFEHQVSKGELLLQTIPAFLKYNYSTVALPLEVTVTHTMMIDDLQSSSGWVITEGSGNFSLDQKDFIRKPAAVTYNVNADKSGYFAVGKKGLWDFSRFDYLQLWVKVSGDIDGELKVILRGERGTWAAWIIKDFSRNEWFALTLPIQRPDLQSQTKIDLTNVREIDIGFQKLKPLKNYPYFKIDEITAVQFSYSLPSYEEMRRLLGTPSVVMLTGDPNFNCSSLLRLTEQGSKIIVFATTNANNTNRNFFFNFLQLEVNGQSSINRITLLRDIDIPLVQVPIISIKSPDVSASFYYKLGETTVAPFVVSKRIGMGEIIYVNIPLNVVNAFREPLGSLAEIFKSLVETEGLQISGSTDNFDSFGSYNTLEGSINLSGDIQFETKHILNIGPIMVQELHIKSKNMSATLNNLTISHLEAYGSTRLVIENSSLRAHANSVSSYLTISGNRSANYLLELSDFTVLSLNLVNGSGALELHMTGGSLNISASALSLVLRNPLVEVDGEIYFESARIQYTNPFVPLAGAVREGLKINGNVTYTVLFTSNDLTIINNFYLRGNAIKISNAESVQMNVSWPSVLMSPSSFVIHLVLIIFALFLIIRKEQMNQESPR